MRTLILGLFLVLGIGMVMGCQNSAKVDQLGGNAGIARDYLMKQGYEIISYNGSLTPYKLTSDLLKTTPYRMFWTLPGNDPDPYLDQMIHIEQFIVRNHPLDHYQANGLKGLGKTTVSVYMSSGAVIGGNAFPVVKNSGIAGGYFGLNGEEWQ